MPRTRQIKPQAFINEELGKLPGIVRWFFVGLWTLADREGRLEDRPERIKALTIPFDDDDPEELLRALESARLITRYAARGQKVIQICTFTTHQKIHPKEAPSQLPAPPRKSSRGKTRQGNTQPRQGDTQQPPSRGKEAAKNPLPSLPSLSSLSSLREEEIGLSKKTNLTPAGKQRGGSASRVDGAGDRAEQIRAVYAHYRSYHPRALERLKASSKEYRLIGARLAEGRSVDELKLAIDGCHRSPHHCGDNDSGTKYQSLELIVRDEKHVRQFIECADQGSSKQARKSFFAAEAGAQDG